MHISPPVGAIVIIAVGLAVTAAFAPPLQGSGAMSVSLPADTAGRLAAVGTAETAAGGSPLSAAQTVRYLLDRYDAAPGAASKGPGK